MKKTTLVWSAIGFALVAAQSARADLAGFMAKPEPAYHWETTAVKKVEGGTIYEISMISQTWQGINWDHRLRVYRPDTVAYPHFCTLYNTGRDSEPTWAMLGMMLARRTKSTFAVLFDNPKQPLYGGLTEDALIVYTWKKYMETGDPSWPMHLPMAKAVVKGMDTIQDLCAKEKLPVLDQFMVCGGSKRGWTTWLVGATRDKRVKGIAPISIDTLHVLKQIPHQLACYGAPSEQVADYTAAGMFKTLDTPKGHALLDLEDPWSYREALTLPKLIVVGTNDQYWAQDALNIYWDDLKGPKYISYTPNSGHGQEDHAHVFASMAAFIDMLESGKPWPKMHWKYTESTDAVTLDVSSEGIAPTAARLFHTAAPTQDFRQYHYSFEPMTATEHGFTGRLEKPASGYASMFGEVEFEIDGQTFTLSTQIHIVHSK